MKAVPHYIALTLLASAMQSVFAADQIASNEQTLSTVVVTATRNEAELSTLPPSVTAVSREKMDEEFINDFTDLSKGEPDISMSRNSRYGLSSVNIRGLDSNRVLMMVDGIRLADTFAFGPYQNNGRDVVDFGSLQAIEIVRGPASSLYGSDALGGVVGMRTIDPVDFLRGHGNFAAQVGADYDSSDSSFGGRATVGGAVGDSNFWLLQIGGREGNELETKGENGSKTAARTEANPQDYSTRNALAKFRTLLDGGHSLGLTADYYRRDNDATLYTDLGDPMLPTVRASRAEDQTERWRVSGDYDFAAQNPGGFLDTAHVQLYAQQQDSEQKTFQTRTNAANWSRTSEYSQDQIGLNAQAGKRFETGAVTQNVLAGMELMRSELTQFRTGTPVNSTLNVRDVPLTKTTQWGVFVQDEIGIANTGLTITPGVRYDSYELSPENDKAFLAQGGKSVGLDDGKVSPKISAAWKANDILTLFAQYSQGFRAPNPMELNGSYVSPMGYAAISNPNLKPETSSGFEVGARIGDEELGANVTVYNNRYKNFIEQASISCPRNPVCFPGVSLIYQSQNISNVEIYGGEARAQWAFAQGWNTWVNVAWATGRNSDTGVALDSVAPLKGQVGVSYRAASWGGSFMVNAADSHDDVSNPSYFQAPGYGVMDLVGWWEPKKDLRINAGVFNLGDKKYWLSSDVVGVAATSKVVDRYSQPGTNARVSVNWKF